jgi:flavin reductase (DIM6/NTAB) family NADH-FMN oxidoreductase RutF
MLCPRRVSRSSTHLPPLFLALAQTRSTKRIAREFFTPNPSPRTHGQIRAILRKTAQPVSVLTAILPSSDPAEQPIYHGATLSSFTSISMHPLPLVAFSIRTPSRMGSSLTTLGTPHTPHMIVNLLSASQSSAATLFSRPDVYSEPFRDIPFRLSHEGIPILTGSLGAFSCALVASIPLDTPTLIQCGLSRKDIQDAESPVYDSGLTSKLFLARIMRVEDTTSSHGPPRPGDVQLDGNDTLPLVYHERHFATVENLRSQEIQLASKRTDVAPPDQSKST